LAEFQPHHEQGMFRPLRTKKAFEQVTAEIKKLMFEGILKPGDRLPKEGDLAKQFGVSRQTVREALRVLELTGFIWIQKGGNSGPLVVDTVVHAVNSLYLDIFQMRKITGKELTTARNEIEKSVLDEAIKNAKDSDIRELENNVAAAEALLAKNIHAFRENVEFHKLLAKASKNKVFVLVMESLMTVVADFRSRHDVKLSLSRMVTKGHGEIVQAMKRRDRGRAAAVLIQHLALEGTALGGESISRRVKQ
jgi:GntR family transcriptional repressor for pyruvate dehydrogenase complex